MKSDSYSTPEEFFRVLRIVFFAFVSVPLLFFLILFYLSKNQAFAGIDGLREFGLALLFVSPAPLFLAFFFYYKKLKEAKQKVSIREKLQEYKSACILKYSLLEFSSILCLISYYFTAHVAGSGVFIGILIVFASQNPTVDRIIRSLKLDRSEAEVIRSNKSVE